MPRFARAAAALALAAALAGPATSFAFRLPARLGPQLHNPADRLQRVPIDPETYDSATRCNPKPKPGMLAFDRWMASHSPRGAFWGNYRCERWGPHSASLHAEFRALDWHLDAGNRRDRAEARRIIDLLLAPDRAGNQHALARRMGIEEIIWDCSYWGAGMSQFERYSRCFDGHGRRLRHVDPTQGHLNHIHFGMTKAGAAMRTSFWRLTAARRA
jgi:hypothetical protein